MARKNLLSGLVDEPAKPSESSTVEVAYPMRGASKSMLRSVSELARQADAFLQGEQVVELDPELIDASFVSDRLSDEGEEYQELLEAIQSRGQDTPILVRTHPSAAGRYMVVFGHRRLKVARALGRKIRVVVKALDERAHVIAQGQENSARANLTFIERALFARSLEDKGYDRETISSALSANAAAVSKMISVASRIPAEVILAIGRAASVGRERWLALSELVVAKPDIARNAVSRTDFVESSSDQRFDFVVNSYAAERRRKGPPANSVQPRTWSPDDGRVRVTIRQERGGVAFELAQKDAKPFGEWISQNLQGLYESFRQASNQTTGE